MSQQCLSASNEWSHACDSNSLKPPTSAGIAGTRIHHAPDRGAPTQPPVCGYTRPTPCYFSLLQVDLADIDIVLVGDSVSMVVHGHDTTLPITLDDMLSHCKAVARGATRAFLIGDLPFGSYELSTTEAVKSAVRMLKEGGMDAVKLEGRPALLLCQE